MDNKKKMKAMIKQMQSVIALVCGGIYNLY